MPGATPALLAASRLSQARVPSVISGFPNVSGQTNLLQSNIEYIPGPVGESLWVAHSTGLSRLTGSIRN